jgi:hypothetical protein
LSIELKQTPLGNHQIRHDEQRKDLRSILGQSPISGFLVSEQVFDVVKRMLNLGPNTGLGFFERDDFLSQLEVEALLRGVCDQPDDDGAQCYSEDARGLILAAVKAWLRRAGRDSLLHHPAVL